MNQLIIRFSGTVSQLKLFKLFCEQRGNIRIEELREGINGDRTKRNANRY